MYECCYVSTNELVVIIVQKLTEKLQAVHTVLCHAVCTNLLAYISSNKETALPSIAALTTLRSSRPEIHSRKQSTAIVVWSRGVFELQLACTARHLLYCKELCTTASSSCKLCTMKLHRLGSPHQVHCC